MTNIDDSISVILDSDNAVISNVSIGTNTVGIAYDSNKGELFASNGNNAVSVISDLSVSPSPTVPEFTAATVISILLVISMVAFSLVKKSLKTRNSRQKKRQMNHLS